MAQKILVVDDEQYLRELYQEVLQQEGYDVETAANGEEALSKLKNGGYAVCLLDLMMPKIDGLTVMSELQKNPPAVKNGPIIILTNLSHEEVIGDAISKGAAAYLIKADITPDVMIREVKKVLEN